MKLWYAVNTKPHSDCYAATTLEHVGLLPNSVHVTPCFKEANAKPGLKPICDQQHVW